jgi:hypothetical protein
MTGIDLLQRAASPLVWVMLSACAPTLPVVVKPLDCPVPAEMLTRHCDVPGLLPAPGAAFSYADLIGIGIDDRNALRACARDYQYLAGVVAECQKVIKDYNDKLVEINQKITNKP